MKQLGSQPGLGSHADIADFVLPVVVEVLAPHGQGECLPGLDDGWRETVDPVHLAAANGVGLDRQRDQLPIAAQIDVDRQREGIVAEGLHPKAW
jgi:hypothetical protein